MTTAREGGRAATDFPHGPNAESVPTPRPDVDIRSPPRGFDELVGWLERWSDGLVLLEEYPVNDVRAALNAVEKAVRAHRMSADRWIVPLQARDEPTSRGARLILSDHKWFETSIEQFWWFFRVVEKEDHRGHRQALGQYGRIFGEALRRHRTDELRLESERSHRRRPVSLPREMLIRQPGRAK